MLFDILKSAVALGAAHQANKAGMKAARKAGECTPCAARAKIQENHASLNAARSQMGLRPVKSR